MVRQVCRRALHGAHAARAAPGPRPRGRRGIRGRRPRARPQCHAGGPAPGRARRLRRPRGRLGSAPARRGASGACHRPVCCAAAAVTVQHLKEGLPARQCKSCHSRPWACAGARGPPAPGRACGARRVGGAAVPGRQRRRAAPRRARRCAGPRGCAPCRRRPGPQLHAGGRAGRAGHAGRGRARRARRAAPRAGRIRRHLPRAAHACSGLPADAAAPAWERRARQRSAGDWAGGDRACHRLSGGRAAGRGAPAGPRPHPVAWPGPRRGRPALRRGSPPARARGDCWGGLPVRARPGARFVRTGRRFAAGAVHAGVQLTSAPRLLRRTLLGVRCNMRSALPGSFRFAVMR